MLPLKSAFGLLSLIAGISLIPNQLNTQGVLFRSFGAINKS